MRSEKPKLDPETVAVVKRVLAMPPKHNAELKVGRTAGGKKRVAKGPASSSKQRSA